MINTAPILSYPVNAFVIEGTPESVFVVKGDYFRWSLTVSVGGVDVSDLLTGTVLIDREEGAAGIAELNLFYPPGATVEPDLVERAVVIDYTSDDGQEAVQTRLFTGVVAEPSWDANSRVMKIVATDNLQNRVEALNVAEIDILTGGTWSGDIFEPVLGRSHWDYAQERMSSRQASLDVSPTGELRVSGWKTSPAAEFVFSDGQSVYESLDVQLAQLRNITNRVEISFSYRYSRLHEGRINLNWRNPETQGASGIGGFCNWRAMSTELPTKSMVFSATKGAALTPVDVSWYELPLSMPNPCGDGSPWINTHEGLLLGATWSGVRRWSQAVTEDYRLTLTTSAGQQAGQQVIKRNGYNLADISEYAGDWPGSAASADPDDLPPETTVPVQAGDQADEARRVAAIECALQVGATEIAASHRATKVSWQVPTSMAIGVDLPHTVQFSEGSTKAMAKCSHRIDELNLESGSALTTLTLSVMRGGGVADQLTAPARLGGSHQSDLGGTWGTSVNLPSQLGGRLTSPDYNDQLDGFSGNYTARQDNALPVFPRRMTVSASEIDSSNIDEKTHSQEFVYSVGVDNNLLEL